MKKLLSDLFAFEPGRFLSSVVLVLVSMLIVTGGRIGIQATPENGVIHWIGFAEVPVWIG